MNHSTKRFEQSGFTLIEVVAVVSLAGILAAVAIPIYEKFRARARQNEAKAALSSLYVAEMNFFTDNGNFTSCLTAIGFAPEGAIRYYAYGFQDATASNTTCGSTNTVNCACAAWSSSNVCGTPCVPGQDVTYFLHNARMRPTGFIANESHLGDQLSRTTFRIRARGQISSSVDDKDSWQINERKQLGNFHTYL